MSLPTLNEWGTALLRLVNVMFLMAAITWGIAMLLEAARRLNYRLFGIVELVTEYELRCNPIAAKEFNRDVELRGADETRVALLAGFATIIVGSVLQVVTIPVVGTGLVAAMYFTGVAIPLQPWLQAVGYVVTVATISIYWWLHEDFHQVSQGWHSI